MQYFTIAAEPHREEARHRPGKRRSLLLSEATRATGVGRQACAPEAGDRTMPPRCAG